LVSNAIKFTTKGKVELRVHRLDMKTLEISVLDTGKGIPPKHLKSIFEPFRQVDITDTRQHGGTGLGLTISSKLVDLMGGKLRVESSILGPIRGSMFAFTFPYQPIEYRIPILPKEPVPSSISSTARIHRQNCKILVAEDDPVSRKLVCRMLQRTGYEVSLACNGEEAVEAYKSFRESLSLVLMDVQMPKLDGNQACRQIRECERISGFSPIPIIALSAGAMKGDREHGLSVGMTDYLTKPVDFQCLVKTLEKHLRAGPNPAA
jgi:CheY-like chemotaxis protein